jgi:hypothetical protein
MSDTYGRMSGMPFAQYDRDSSSWKTSEVTSLWALTLSSLTLPNWGSLHDGALYEHPTPERLTTGHGFSFLPTPINSDYNTPASEWLPDRERLQLRDIAALLPTPAVNDMGAGKTPEWWQEWTARMELLHRGGGGHGKSLEQEALKMLPTPRAREPVATTVGYGKALLESITGKPQTGATTHQQSNDGQMSSDEQHPLLPFDETSATD